MVEDYWFYNWLKVKWKKSMTLKCLVFCFKRKEGKTASIGENCLGILKRDWETSCVQISPDYLIQFG